MEEWRITELVISGTLSALSLIKLTEPLGSLSDVALSRVEMDIDTDGDGEINLGNRCLSETVRFSCA